MGAGPTSQLQLAKTRHSRCCCDSSSGTEQISWETCCFLSHFSHPAVQHQRRKMAGNNQDWKYEEDDEEDQALDETVKTTFTCLMDVVLSIH